MLFAAIRLVEFRGRRQLIARIWGPVKANDDFRCCSPEKQADAKTRAKLPRSGCGEEGGRRNAAGGRSQPLRFKLKSPVQCDLGSPLGGRVGVFLPSGGFGCLSTSLIAIAY